MSKKQKKAKTKKRPHKRAAMQRRARPEFETLGNLVAETTEMYRELRELRDFVTLVVTTWKKPQHAEFRAEVTAALEPPEEEAEDEPEPNGETPQDEEPEPDTVLRDHYDDEARKATLRQKKLDEVSAAVSDSLAEIQDGEKPRPETGEG